MSALRNRLLFVFIFLFLALRLTTLLTAVEEVSWHEELFTGVLPKEWMQDWKLPIWEYQASEYHSGSLVVGALATPFFLLFGPNLFALKLAPLLFSLGTMVLLYIFLTRFFSLKVAVWAILLYIFCPPSFTKLSFFAMGFHPESNLFSAAMLLSLYQFLYGKKYRKLSLALFGLSAGLGVWFSYTTLIALAACLITWFLVDFRSFFSRTLLLFALCFLMGFLPWIFFNLTYHFVGLDFFRYRFAGPSETPGAAQELLRALSTFKKLVLDSLPKSFSFPTFLSIPGQIWSYLYYFIVLSLVAPFFIRKRKTILTFFRRLRSSKGQAREADLRDEKVLPFFLYPLLFLLAYSCVGLEPTTKFNSPANHFRYFSVLYFFGFPLAALAGSHHKKSSLLLGALLALGLVGQSSLVFKEPFGRALHYKGYSYSRLVPQWVKMKYPLPEGLDDLLMAIKRFSGPERDELNRSIAEGLMWAQFDEKPDMEAALAMAAKFPASARHHFWEAFGMRTGRGIGKEKAKSVDPIPSVAHDLSRKEKKYFYQGMAYGYAIEQPLRDLDSFPPWLPIEESSTFYFLLGRSIGLGFDHLPRLWQIWIVDLVERSNTMEKNWIYRGIGSATTDWVFWTERFDSLRPIFEKFPVERKQDFFWGVGWRFREGTFEDRIRALDRIKWLPKEFQPDALEGLKYYETSPGL